MQNRKSAESRGISLLARIAGNQMTDKCPSCQANLQGPEIQESYKDLFSGKTHYSLRMPHFDVKLNRTTEWQCPYCEHRWPA